MSASKPVRSDARGFWYLLTGLLIGLILGLVYAWKVQPVRYVDTPPASLEAGFKDQYRMMIAIAFAADNDLVRASERLKLLQDDDPFQALTGQAQRILAAEGSLEEARYLSALAVAIEQNPALFAPVSATQTPEE
jgi:hypothetical protein